MERGRAEGMLAAFSDTQVSPRGGTSPGPPNGLPAPDELGLHERNRVVSLAEDIYIGEEEKGRVVARNIGAMVKLFQEGRPPSTLPASKHIAKILFLKLRSEFPERLAAALK